MSPETAKVDVGLGHVHVGEKEPQTEDGLGKHVENGIRDDLGVDRSPTGTVGNTPDAMVKLVEHRKGREEQARTYTG